MIDLVGISTPITTHSSICSCFANTVEQGETKLFLPSLPFAASHLLSSLEIKHSALPLLWTFERFLLCSLPWFGFQFKWQWRVQIGKVKWLICKTELLISGENRRPWILHAGSDCILQRQGKHPDAGENWWTCEGHSPVLNSYHWYRNNCHIAQMSERQNVWLWHTVVWLRRKHNKARRERSKN